MPFPRFHLSTLLLFCVACGATLGLIFSPEPWEWQHSFLTQGNPGPSLAFSHDNQKLAVLNQSAVTLYDLAAKNSIWSVSRDVSRTGLRNVQLRFVSGDRLVESQIASPTSSLPVFVYLSAQDGRVVGSPANLDPADHSASLRAIPTVSAPREETALRQEEGNRNLFSKSPQPETQTSDSRIYAAAFSPDQRYLAIRRPGRVQIYHRTQSYGFTGLLEQPLFWILIVSSLFLALHFIRWLKPLFQRRNRAVVY